MAEMKCDLCGGRIVVGLGGVARCQNCDMEYSQDRVQEKLHEAHPQIKTRQTAVYQIGLLAINLYKCD